MNSLIDRIKLGFIKDEIRGIELQIYEPCIYRTIKERRLVCGRIQGRPWCELKNKLINKDICLSCKERKAN